MADSKTSSTDTTKDSAPTRNPGKQGLIRWEAVAPFTIFVLLVWAYFYFFFDNHLRNAIEYAGTHINGAEVNVAALRTSFWKASLDLRQIQITDVDEPSRNKLQIGEVRWRMLWDALLRGKITIADASILEVAVGVPRERPGRVLPPPPPGSKSAAEKVRDQALDSIQEEFSKNILGDVAAILDGVDPQEQLKNMEGQLRSSSRVKELRAELEKKERQWRDRLERLPQSKDLKAYEARLKAVKLDAFKSPAEVQRSLKELDAIYRDIDAAYKNIQATGKALGGDVNTYERTLQELESMIRNDIQDLESRLKIPKLDVASLSRSIFGPMILGRLREAEFYMTKAREYMPPKKTKAEKAQFAPPTPRERVAGRNYKFGRPNTYPLFWLRNAEISSKATAGADWSGDLSGRIRDVTDDPVILGRPMVATFKGEFPKQKLFGVAGELTIDHTSDDPVERLDLNVASLPIGGRTLVKSSDVTLGFDSAQASTAFKAELRGNEVNISTQSTFHKTHETLTPGESTTESGRTEPGDSFEQGAARRPTFLFAEAKQPILASLLQATLADIPNVTLNAGIRGNWTHLNIHINSNLGSELARSFDKQLQLKITEARAKLQALVDEQVGKEKAKLTAEFNKVKSQVEGLIKSKQEELNKVKKSIETAKNDAIKSQGQKLEKEGKKALEDLKKKFKF